MLLTIFYASATLLQSWRMRSLSAIIMNKIRESYSVSFYKTGTDESGEFDVTYFQVEIFESIAQYGT